MTVFMLSYTAIGIAFLILFLNTLKEADTDKYNKTMSLLPAVTVIAAIAWPIYVITFIYHYLGKE